MVVVEVMVEVVEVMVEVGGTTAGSNQQRVIWFNCCC